MRCAEASLTVDSMAVGFASSFTNPSALALSPWSKATRALLIASFCAAWNILGMFSGAALLIASAKEGMKSAADPPVNGIVGTSSLGLIKACERPFRRILKYSRYFGSKSDKRMNFLLPSASPSLASSLSLSGRM